MGRIRITRGSQSKVICPYCSGGGSAAIRRTYKHFVDTQTGVLLPERFGICDRDSCSAGGRGKFPSNAELSLFFRSLEPKREARVSMVELRKRVRSERVSAKEFAERERRVSVRDSDLYFDGKSYVACTDGIASADTFHLFLARICPERADSVGKVLKAYGIRMLVSGNNRLVCFPYVDGSKVIHDIQCLYYGSDGKRRSDVFPLWLYRSSQAKRLRGDDWFTRYSSVSPKIKTFFGGHLIGRLGDFFYSYVCIVEGAKTAIVCSLAFPRILFLGSFNKHISDHHFESIGGGNRNIFLLPDRGQYDSWHGKFGSKYHVSDLLEKTDYDDIADYIVSDRGNAVKLIVSALRSASVLAARSGR